MPSIWARRRTSRKHERGLIGNQRLRHRKLVRFDELVDELLADFVLDADVLYRLQTVADFGLQLFERLGTDIFGQLVIEGRHFEFFDCFQVHFEVHGLTGDVFVFVILGNRQFEDAIEARGHADQLSENPGKNCVPPISITASLAWPTGSCRSRVVPT